MLRRRRIAVGVLTAAVACGFAWAGRASAVVIRGTGTAALRGGDLTDPENNGDPQANTNYNATFSASEEPDFASEGAFNVFDNQVGGGDMKWCCGDQNNFPTNPISVSATFTTPQVLRSFTITSGNDTAERDPRVWQIQGSNDGANFTTIFSRSDAATTPWTERDQVLEYVQGEPGYPIQSTAYSTIRFITTATGLTGGARFQLGEIEYFNTIPEPSGVLLAGLALAGLGLRRRGRTA